MKKRLTAVAVAAGLAGGSLAGLTLTQPGLVGAQDGTTTTTPGPDTPSSPEVDRSERIAEVLRPLVEAGTITQAQADAVRAALEAAGPIGRPGHGFGHKGVALDTAAAALGMTAEELRTALAGGQSLAQVAQARGVDRQVVIDALVAEARSSAAERVAGGDIAQAEADEKLADVVERVTAMVDGQFPGRRFGPGPRGDDDAAEGSNSSTVFRTRSPSGSGSSV